MINHMFLLKALLAIGSFIKRLTIDYISEIIVGTILYPYRIIDSIAINYKELIIKPVELYLK